MTSELSDSLLRFVIAGCFTQDYILPVSGSPQVNVLGGNLAYAAAGLRLWGKTAGLIARLGEDYPMHWLERFRSLGFDLSGIKVLPDSMDTRYFMCHEDPKKTLYDDPVQHFADRGLTFPPGLLGYQVRQASISSRTTPLRQSLPDFRCAGFLPGSQCGSYLPNRLFIPYHPALCLPAGSGDHHHTFPCDWLYGPFFLGRDPRVALRYYRVLSIRA